MKYKTLYKLEKVEARLSRNKKGYIVLIFEGCRFVTAPRYHNDAAFEWWHEQIGKYFFLSKRLMVSPHRPERYWVYQIECSADGEPIKVEESQNVYPH